MSIFPLCPSQSSSPPSLSREHFHKKVGWGRVLLRKGREHRNDRIVFRMHSAVLFKKRPSVTSWPGSTVSLGAAFVRSLRQMPPCAPSLPCASGQSRFSHLHQARGPESVRISTRGGMPSCATKKDIWSAHSTSPRVPSYLWNLIRWLPKAVRPTLNQIQSYDIVRVMHLMNLWNSLT